MINKKGQFQKGHKINLGNKNHLGFKHSDETKEKLRQINLGKKLSDETKKKIGENGFHLGMLGKKQSEETKEKRAKKNRGKKRTKEQRDKISGENCHLWRGGITPENAKIRNSIEYRLWRESVFARDNWTCQKTFIKGGELQAHHIQNFADYPELRLAIDNGITLSKKEHSKFHRKYGKNNTTIEQVEEFLIPNAVKR